MGTSETTKLNGTTALTLAALGVVFGDIGTSPLYSIREAFHGPHAIEATEANVLGVLSLIVWSLILVISVKYLVFVMRADNKGEGGVMALTALVAPQSATGFLGSKNLVLYLGLFGSALLFGDGIITPAISVLSAVEGLNVATPLFEDWVLPITIAVLIVLFLFQSFGTAKIGSIFGPIIFVWFLTIGALGASGIIQNSVVMNALSPLYAIQYFTTNGFQGFFVLGAVFLAVTGGEALYADMGHFGRKPIQRAWFFVALPGLLLNYFGQGALLLRDPAAADNPFYKLAPEWALYPLVVIATLATVIASQALISGVFSLSRQANQLGYFPRMRIIHTSSEEIGQIYVPHVNWMLLIATCWLVIEFKSSSALASAYGIAVSLTMIITTILACSVARQRWKWAPWQVFSILVFLGALDLMFVVANVPKIGDGGWVPLILGLIIFSIMTTWRKGRQVLMQRIGERSISFAEFFADSNNTTVPRVRGIAVFMTGNAGHMVPPALLHNLKHNRILHSQNVILSVQFESLSYVRKERRVEIVHAHPGFVFVTARFGFSETPDIHRILEACAENGCVLPISDVTFFLGRETLLPGPREGLAKWRKILFSFLSRNAEKATSYFNIPTDQVVEIGIQIEL